MKILIIVDKKTSAIDRLAEMVKNYNPHFNITIYPVHPKNTDPIVLAEVYKKMQECDLMDVHYWKSGEVIRQAFPDEFKKIKKILCHFNPYDLDKQPWNEIYDQVVVGNQEMQNKLPYAKLIPYAVDFETFTFKDTRPENVVNMVVGRIEGKKGVKEVAQVCQELGYTFHLVGRISKRDYFEEVQKAGGDMFHFFENVTDEELCKKYHEATIHVNNSVDGFESGTLPILEAMACGTPVLTRNIGHVPDITNGGNMVVRDGQVDDVEDLKKNLKDLMENKEQQKKIRAKALYTVKNKPAQKMARQYSTFYYQVLNDRFPLVSVIIPTKNDEVTLEVQEKLLTTLQGAISQDYPHYELVVVDSGKTPIYSFVKAASKLTKVPIKYIYFEKPGYTLAEARNRGVVEAEGKILVFCDDRLKMNVNAITEFVKMSKQHCWLWGVKDDVQKHFVENFSSIRREDLITAGIFNERVDRYGAMSEEIRTRFSKLGYAFQLVSDAHAYSIARSHKRKEKMQDIIWSKLLLFKMYG